MFLAYDNIILNPECHLSVKIHRRQQHSSGYKGSLETGRLLVLFTQTEGRSHNNSSQRLLSISLSTWKAKKKKRCKSDKHIQIKCDMSVRVSRSVFLRGQQRFPPKQRQRRVARRSVTRTALVVMHSPFFLSFFYSPAAMHSVTISVVKSYL